MPRDYTSLYYEQKAKIEELERCLFDVFHQRTGPLGLKFEDDLFRENQRLYHRCVKHIRHL